MLPAEKKATYRPSAEAEGEKLKLFDCSPDEPTLIRVVLALAAQPAAMTPSASASELTVTSRRRAAVLRAGRIGVVCMRVSFELSRWPAAKMVEIRFTSSGV